MWHLSSEIISGPLVGEKYECHIVIDVIDVDELDEGNISDAAESKTNNGRLISIVATNIIASRPPERRPTGTPHACGKNF